MLLSFLKGFLMRDKKYIFFDLDGTLTNSEKSIITCIDYAAQQLSLPELPMEIKRKFIGPPLLDSFAEYFSLDKPTAQIAVEKYRELYSAKALYMDELFDGAEQMIIALKNAGKKLFTATSKPEKYAKIILHNVGADKYFERIVGASFDESRSNKIDVMKSALKISGAENSDECVMIGDRCYDAQGAAHIGIDCIGALWGFGSREELQAAGCRAVCEKPLDLLQMLI